MENLELFGTLSPIHHYRPAGHEQFLPNIRLKISFIGPGTV